MQKLTLCEKKKKKLNKKHFSSTHPQKLYYLIQLFVRKK